MNNTERVWVRWVRGVFGRVACFCRSGYFGAGQSGSVCSAGNVLPPQLKKDQELRVSWLQKGTIRNSLGGLDPHRSASVSRGIIRRIKVENIKSRKLERKLTHFGWFLTGFEHFFGL